MSNGVLFFVTLSLAGVTRYVTDKLMRAEPWQRPAAVNTALGIWWLIVVQILSWIAILTAMAYGFMHLPWWQPLLAFVVVLMLVVPLLVRFVLLPIGLFVGSILLPLPMLALGAWLVSKW